MTRQPTQRRRDGERIGRLRMTGCGYARAQRHASQRVFADRHPEFA